MAETSIEWTDRVWNPVRGCSRVSEGCRHCYAERYAARFAGPGLPWEGFAKVSAPRDGLDRVGRRRNGWTGRVELIPEKLDEPLRWRKPARVFVNSMSDLFHEALPDEAIDRVFAVMMLAPHHTFQVLTKRPARMVEYFRAPDLYPRILRIADRELRPKRPRLGNVAISDPAAAAFRWWIWLGVSVEDQRTADERIPLLLQTPAAVRFVSYEPAIGPVNLRLGRDTLDPMSGAPPIDWVIVGGESGPGARPFDVAWARSVVRQCRDAGVACFVKQLGANSGTFKDVKRADGQPGWFRQRLRDPKGGDPAEWWPEDLRIREFPA